MESRPYQMKSYIDKFNRTYPQNLIEYRPQPRAAVPNDVIICKRDGFYCNNRKLDIAVNDPEHPFVMVNAKYITGLQQYDGKPFNAERWVFYYDGSLLPYMDNHMLGIVNGFIGLTDVVKPNAWDPFVG